MFWNIELKSIELENGTALGLSVGNPQKPEKAMIIILVGKKGLIVCRNFDIKALDERGICAARVQGISSFEEALKANIESFTTKAKELGINLGMTGREALAKFL